jgi:hypothetical protein
VACRSALAACMMAFSRSILRMISCAATSSFMVAVVLALAGRLMVVRCAVGGVETIVWCQPRLCDTVPPPPPNAAGLGNRVALVNAGVGVAARAFVTSRRQKRGVEDVVRSVGLQSLPRPHLCQVVPLLECYRRIGIAFELALGRAAKASKLRIAV